MSEVTLNDTALRGAEARSRAAVLKRLRVSDLVFRGLTRGAALLVLALLSGVILAQIR